MLVKFRVFHHHAVPCGVVGHQIHDDLHATFVGFGDEPFEIIQRPVIRVHRVIIADGIGAAEIALAEFLADGMNRHDPKNGDTEILKLIELGDDAVEVPAGEKSRGKIS